MQNLNIVNWTDALQNLDEHGVVKLHALLPKTQCEELVSLYTQENLYRSIINMQRYRFGIGNTNTLVIRCPPLSKI